MGIIELAVTPSYLSIDVNFLTVPGASRSRIVLSVCAVGRSVRHELESMVTGHGSGECRWWCLQTSRYGCMVVIAATVAWDVTAARTVRC
jgi:hypothetical protein